MSLKVPSRGSDQFNLRLPDGMREKIATEAEKAGRSMNSEIIHRLSATFEAPGYITAGLAYSEDLSEALSEAASFSGRTVVEEATHRLRESLLHNDELADELRRQMYLNESRYNEIMKLFIQLTPEERRLLEERSEIAAKTPKFTSKQIGDFVRLNPIGKRGRIHFADPKSDYSALFPTRHSQKNPQNSTEDS